MKYDFDIALKPLFLTYFDGSILPAIENPDTDIGPLKLSKEEVIKRIREFQAKGYCFQFKVLFFYSTCLSNIIKLQNETLHRTTFCLIMVMIQILKRMKSFEERIIYKENMSAITLLLKVFLLT